MVGAWEEQGGQELALPSCAALQLWVLLTQGGGSRLSNSRWTFFFSLSSKGL